MGKIIGLDARLDHLRRATGAEHAADVVEIRDAIVAARDTLKTLEAELITLSPYLSGRFKKNVDAAAVLARKAINGLEGK